MAIDYLNPLGINTFQSPLQTDGQIVHAVNVTAPGIGVIAKRPGYGTIIGTTGAQINTIFDFPFQSGTQLYLYAASGSKLFYSSQGTGAWTQASPGTIAANAYVGHAVFNNFLGIGDGVTNLWTTGNGTSFTQPGSAPVAQYMAVFHNRLYTTDGTTSNLQYSVANDITNWQNSGTSDSSFIVTTSPGANAGLFVIGDRLVTTKTRGNMFHWDDTSLVDMSTVYGPSSPRSIAQIDDYWFYMNQYGIFGFDGATKNVLSNPIQRQFYNRSNTGIGTAAIGTAPATTHFWDYLVAVGTVTDDFTGRQISNALIKYDYQKNQFLNWSLATAPTALHSYIDINGRKQLLFGDAGGNVYQFDPTKTSDNGTPIQTELVFLYNYSNQQTAFSPTSASMVSGSNYEKRWKWWRGIFNVGCEANIQFAFSNTLSYTHLRWSEAINMRIGDGDYWQVSDGVIEIRFPNDPNNLPRSRFLFVRIYDESDNSQWQFFGSQCDAEVQIIT